MSRENIFKDADLAHKKYELQNLSGYKFIKCNLYQTSFHLCDLSKAQFKDCSNINTASFKRCNLEETEFEDMTMLKEYGRCPSHGSFIGWKATKNAIVKLLIPEEAERISPLGSRHFRTNKVIVLEITTKGGNHLNESYGKYFDCLYKVGETVVAEKLCTDVRKWCEHGIGFFLTKQEAEEFL